MSEPALFFSFPVGEDLLSVSLNRFIFHSQQAKPRVATRIGDVAVDLAILAEAGLFAGVHGLNDAKAVFSEVGLIDFSTVPSTSWFRPIYVSLLTIPPTLLVHLEPLHDLGQAHLDRHPQAHPEAPLRL